MDPGAARSLRSRLPLATFWPRLRRSTPSHGADELMAALKTERPRWKSAAALTI